MAFQLKNGIYDHPFTTDPVEPVLSFAEWIEKRPSGDPYAQKEVENIAKTIEDKDKEAQDEEARLKKRREKKKLQRERKRSTPQLGKKEGEGAKKTPVGTPKKTAVPKTAAKDLKAPPQNPQVGQLINLIDWDSPRSVKERERNSKKSYNPFLNSPSPVAKTEAPATAAAPAKAASIAKPNAGLSGSTGSAYPEFFNADAAISSTVRLTQSASAADTQTNPFAKSSSFERIHEGVQEYNPFRLSESN